MHKSADLTSKASKNTGRMFSTFFDPHTQSNKFTISSQFLIHYIDNKQFSNDFPIIAPRSCIYVQSEQSEMTKKKTNQKFEEPIWPLL